MANREMKEQRGMIDRLKIGMKFWIFNIRFNLILGIEIWFAWYKGELLAN